MYKLKPEIEYHKFFKQVTKCSHDVIYETPNRDHINLKSFFSRFVFASLAVNKDYFTNGTLLFADEDLDFLKDFIE